MTQPEQDPPSTPPTPVDLPSGWFGRLLAQLARAPVRSTTWFLVAGVLLTALSLPVAAKLRLNGAFDAMLPDTAPSVIDLEKLIDRFGVASNMSLAVQAPDKATALAATRELARRIEASKDPALVGVDAGVQDFQAF